MDVNHLKKPKDVEGKMMWKNGLSWRDVYFQTSGDSIYLYPNRRGAKNMLLSISLLKVNEVVENETKFRKRCFKILLKSGDVEQFRFPATVVSEKIKQWIGHLRHAVAFWKDKEQLGLKKHHTPRRKVTLESPDESLDVEKHRIFFSLWNGEMIGLLVRATSTFPDVYSRIFAYSCAHHSCSICQIRHQSCDLWAVDISGSARSVKNKETLLDLEKSGHSLFVMEHHHKVLVVFFSDFSYEVLTIPSGSTAKEVLQMDVMSRKLSELSCFDPALFLCYENGTELQFYMNDCPFKYLEDGRKIVARSKRILRPNSVKKTGYEKIAEIRWNEFEKHLRRQKASKAAQEYLSDQIRNLSGADEELCFFDDHFALNNDSPRQHIAVIKPSVLTVTSSSYDEKTVENNNVPGSMIKQMETSVKPDTFNHGSTNCFTSNDVSKMTCDLEESGLKKTTCGNSRDNCPQEMMIAESKHIHGDSEKILQTCVSAEQCIPSNPSHVPGGISGSSDVPAEQDSQSGATDTGNSCESEQRERFVKRDVSSSCRSRRENTKERSYCLRRCLSDLNIRYSFTTTACDDSNVVTCDKNVMSRDTRVMSEPDLVDEDNILRVTDVYMSGDSDNDVTCHENECPTLNGPTWTFAKRVEECVRKILVVKNDHLKVEELISKELCIILYELLEHGLKKNVLGISFFSIGTNVWGVCQDICKITNVAVEIIERIKDAGGTIHDKFHFFIRECIRHEILSRWFELLSSEKVQKQMMKYYVSSAVVLEPEHSKAMEHLKLYLDGLNVLQLKKQKRNMSKNNEDNTWSFFE